MDDKRWKMRGSYYEGGNSKSVTVHSLVGRGDTPIECLTVTHVQLPGVQAGINFVAGQLDFR